MKELAWHRALGRWWTSCSAPERWLVAAAALCLGLVLYVWLLLSTMHARQRLLPEVTELRAQAIRQSRQADEIERLRALPPAAPVTTDLRQLVQRQLDASGLRQSLVSIEPVGARQVKLVFGSVAFADWLTWADDVRAQQLRIAAVRIQSRDAPGQVSVTVTLERPGR